MFGIRVRREHLKRYAAAVVLVAGASVLAAIARPMFEGRAPQALFVVAVLLAAAYGGLGPGLLAAALSTAVISGLFQDAVVSLIEVRPGLMTFAGLGVVISLVMEQFRRSRAALERSRDRLKQANAELSRRSEALARSNEELRRFAYALSHDLQNPLRTVSIFAEHLATHNNESLDQSSSQSLRFVIEGVGRMQEMIRGLLDYSTVVHEESSGRDHADSNAILQAVLADLRGVIEERGAVVSFDDLPAIAAAPGAIHQLFLNIISNAIKYCDSRTPEVHIAARRNGNECVFSVRDNGIGIDMQYAEKIFGLFERLHGAAKYGGSGIGLAICRAIVQRYGGRIWVESELGRGSTFFFTMPCESGWNVAKSA